METAQQYQERLNKIVKDGLVALSIGAGHKLRLFERLPNTHDTAITADNLAKTTKCKARYVKEWLGCMTAAKIVYVTSDDTSDKPEERYFIPKECFGTFGALPELSAMMIGFAGFTDKLVECAREGGPHGYSYGPVKGIWDFLEKARPDEEYMNRELFSRVKKVKKEESVKMVVDLGCGTGWLSIMVAKEFPNSSVIGLDLSEYSLQTAKKKAEDQGVKNVTFENREASNFPDGWEKKFDWVIMWNFIHDVSNPEEVMEQVRKVLKDDGIISIEDPGVHSNHSDNIGNAEAPWLYTAGLYMCLPNALSEKPHAGKGLGWGIENKRIYFTEFWKFTELEECRTEARPNLMTFIKNSESK